MYNPTQIDNALADHPSWTINVQIDTEEALLTIASGDDQFLFQKTTLGELRITGSWVDATEADAAIQYAHKILGA